MASPQQTTIAIGKYRLTGWPAQIVLILILAGIIALFWFRRGALAPWPVWVSIAVWIVYSSYWSAAAKNSAAAKTVESPESRRVHELLLNFGLLLVFIPVPGLRQPLFTQSIISSVAGLSLQGACLALAIWARRHLGHNWSGRIEIKVDHELIRSGPYRVLRHPIYTAILGMCVGSALVIGQVHALIGLAMVMYAYGRKIRMEEAKLREAFGPSYESYRRKTWALVPGLF